MDEQEPESHDPYAALRLPGYRRFILSLGLATLGLQMQGVTPGPMLGRVSSVNQIFIGSSNELGAFESGLTARFLGLIPSVVFGGCMTLMVVGVVAWRVPTLRRMDRIR